MVDQIRSLIHQGEHQNRRKRGRPSQRVVADPSVLQEEFRWGAWQHYLLPEERDIYKFLRHCAFDGTYSATTKLEKAGGCGRQRFKEIFARLEVNGLVSCEQQGSVIPMLVIIHEIPAQPPMLEAAAMEARVLRAGKSDGGEVAGFVVWFANEWENRHGAAYRILQGKDYGITARLLKTHTLEDLKRYALHFLRIFEPPHTIATFSVRINEVVASYDESKEAQL